MITFTEEPYDGPLGTAFVRELLAELNARYADEGVGLSDEERSMIDAAYLAEVTADQVERPHGVFVVAWVEGRPAGCGGLRPSGDRGVAEIKRMYTRPSDRGAGVGRAVLRELERLAVELGYRHGRLETGTGQPEAMALYRSHGWTPIESYGRFAHSPSSRCFEKALGP